jgi:hypothetical protein
MKPTLTSNFHKKDFFAKKRQLNGIHERTDWECRNHWQSLKINTWGAIQQIKSIIPKYKSAGFLTD